jgi:hypothetical protein
MKSFLNLLILIFLISSIKIHAQKRWMLNDALNFAFYQNGSVKTKTFAFITNNQFEWKYWTILNNLNYTLLYNPKLTQNELAEKFSFSYSRGRHSAFSIYQYNHSLVRNINENHLIGVGYGIRDSIFRCKINLSYALLSENISYISNSSQHNIRNSFRIKISRETKKIGFSSEYYYQPNVRNRNDFTLYGTTKLSFKIKESLALSISDVYNYFNTSTTPVIHNFTVGISYNYKSTE